MVTDIGLGVVVAVGVLLGLVAGMVVGWIVSRRMGRKDFALQSEAIRAESESEVARLNAEIIESRGQIRVLETDRASLQGEKSSAKSLEDRLEPVREALEGLRRTTQQAEIERAKSAAELRTQIDGVQRNYTSLESATKQLVAAMSSGQSRGQWGEMQLEQLLEHSGLVEGVHFRRQDSRMTEAGGARPDVVVDLPGGGEILIDAKFPFDAYWRAIKADDEVEIDAHLHKHAEDVLARAKELSSKRYWESNSSPDFVVMFLPLESLLSRIHSCARLAPRTRSARAAIAWMHLGAENRAQCQRCPGREAAPEPLEARPLARWLLWRVESSPEPTVATVRAGTDELCRPEDGRFHNSLHDQRAAEADEPLQRLVRRARREPQLRPSRPLVALLLPQRCAHSRRVRMASAGTVHAWSSFFTVPNGSSVIACITVA